MTSPNQTRHEYLKLIAGCLTPSTLAAVIADLDDIRETPLVPWTRRLLAEHLADLIGDEGAAEAIAGEQRANEAADGIDPAIEAAEAVEPGSSRLLEGPSEADIAEGIALVKKRFERVF